jgi:hypothetical protein
VRLTRLRLEGRRRVRAAIIAGLLITAIAASVVACGRAETPRAAKPNVDAYRGLATWLDNWDWKTWGTPGRGQATRIVNAMKRRGVQTLFLATSHHSQTEDVVEPEALSAVMEAARHRGMRLIAWYQPSFTNIERDYRRAMAAIRFRTRGGERFDSFALDIEARVVTPTALRNSRLLQLSARIRRTVGQEYTLGAIVPSPRLLELYPNSWPLFPYDRLAGFYDVFLPMAYWTFHTGTFKGAYGYTAKSISGIREETNTANVTVHAIGGTARHANAAEVRGFLGATRACRAVGVSLYDFLTTTRAEWQELTQPDARPPREAACA